jgi:hypothetical protein
MPAPWVRMGGDFVYRSPIGQSSTDLQRDSRVADVVVGPPPPTNQEERGTADRE